MRNEECECMKYSSNCLSVRKQPNLSAIIFLFISLRTKPSHCNRNPFHSSEKARVDTSRHDSEQIVNLLVPQIRFQKEEKFHH
jgi:hypothetical protein